MKNQRFSPKNSGGGAIRRHRSWRGFAVEHVVPAIGDTFEYAWQSDLHFCALHDIVLDDGGIRAGDAAENNQKNLRDSLTYVPKGAAVQGWSQLSQRRNSYTAIYFDPAELHEELDQRFSTELGLRVYFRDPELLMYLRRFSTLLMQDEPDELYAETLGLMTVLQIQKAGAGKDLKRPGISRRALSRVLEYVDQNLENQIGLDDLAAVAGLSRFHFNRAFKAETGETPYQYLLYRRLEKARRLLGEDALSVEQVAAAVGFRDASYFRKAFKARTGISPLGLRKSAG
ncbi:AraC family transcriptional regulator [Pseudorhizobium pelagicum]|uniref:AraC family transcriptional regulator n=1 Tax=Pseudorhizobium pelagicum TaxID=1509405 RepID=UPI002989D42D